jgi:hypothetical protein
MDAELFIEDPVLNGICASHTRTREKEREREREKREIRERERQGEPHRDNK